MFENKIFRGLEKTKRAFRERKTPIVHLIWPEFHEFPISKILSNSIYSSLSILLGFLDSQRQETHYKVNLFGSIHGAVNVLQR